MKFILIHNGDDQGRVIKARVKKYTIMQKILPVPIKATFVVRKDKKSKSYRCFSDETLDAVSDTVKSNGPLNVIWSGHGARKKGNPMTNNKHIIRSSEFVKLFSLLRPRVVIFASCEVGKWIPRVLKNLEGGLFDKYSKSNVEIHWYANKEPLMGAQISHEISQYFDKGKAPFDVHETTITAGALHGIKDKKKTYKTTKGNYEAPF